MFTFKRLPINKSLMKLTNCLLQPHVLTPVLFDVSLRDGLQSLTKEQQTSISHQEKISIYHDMMFNYSPNNVEIGSIVSNNIFPIFNDTVKLLDYVEQTKKTPLDTPNHYILIPNSNKLSTVINLKNAHNFSFITSMSNSFQLQNINKNIRDTITDLKLMLNMIENSRVANTKTKLYVSCISECPIEGKIDNDEIVEHLLFYNNMNIDTICLADTCGTLSLDDFSYIVDKCIHQNINPNKLSLHLHYKKENEEVITKIIHYALSNNIIQFDVSMLDLGGCPLTLDRSKMLSNLSYELFNKCFKSYVGNA